MRQPAVASRARITAIGTYRPARVLTNADLAPMVDASDEWIVTRTGIRERRVADADEFTSDLCVRAVESLAARSGKDLADVDMIIAATITPDYYMPSVACQVQDRLAIPAAGALDINAACAGFAYGLLLANALVTAGAHGKVLVVAGETLTKVLDYTDRGTSVLFGDGAGAVLVERDERGAFLAAHVGSDGAGGKHLHLAGLSARVAGGRAERYIRQNGREVFRWAVETVSDGVAALTKKAGIALDAVDWFVPHSANSRIIEAICRRLHFPLERTLSSLEENGNTSAASIPLALDGALRGGRLRGGERVLIYGFGGGLVHAGLLVTWTADGGVG